MLRAVTPTTLKTVDSSSPPSPTPFPARRAEHRRQAARRLAGRVVKPVEREPNQPSALSLSRPLGFKQILLAVAFALAALAVHGGIIVAVGLLDRGGHADLRPSAPIRETVVVDFVEPPPLPDPVPSVTPPEPRTTVAEPTPAPSPKKARPKTRPKRVIQADPVDVAPTPIEAKPVERRRVVGLSYESTVQGGSGPAFAVGNTRMGDTAKRAAAPTSVEKLTPSTGRVQPKGTAQIPNRVATRIPTQSVVFVKPKRLNKIEPRYPEVLKSRGIEGNVVVLIRIDAQGQVTDVKVVKSSGYSEFDRVARQTALSERFAPATRNGTPVAYGLKYTYRFRIRDL